MITRLIGLLAGICITGYDDVKGQLLTGGDNFCFNFRNAGVGGKPDNPVAYFTFDDDWSVCWCSVCVTLQS